MTTPPSGPDAGTHTGSGATPPTTETVEALVRRQLSTALGGRRGMVEAAVPTLVFTVLWLTTRNLTVAVGASVAVALVELAARLVQRQTVKFVVNALVGIGIGWFFVHLSASRGGSADDQALAYFLPGPALQHRVRRRVRPDLPDRLAVRRLHDRQRHRRPDRLARGPPGRPALLPADLAAGAAVRASGSSCSAPIWLAGHSGSDLGRHRGGHASACSRW